MKNFLRFNFRQKIFSSYFFAVIFILLSSFASFKCAFSQVIDSSFFQWTVYELQGDESDEKKCYMITYPVKTDSDQSLRDQSYIIITRYQNRRIEEIGINSGFEYKLNSKLLISIDNERFQMSTNADMAWARSIGDDVRIIQKMLNGSVVKVRADSSIGTFAIDEYSLKGIAKAYSRMRAICK